MSTVGKDEPANRPLRAAVLTISDTRTVENDSSGQAASDLLVAGGHQVTARQIVADDAALVRASVLRWTSGQAIDVVVATGGTGLSPRDWTLEALAPLFSKTIPGFGELFRALSFREIGPAAMLSRAAAGTIDRTVVFLLPGSTAAVRLAMTDLILPQLGHITRELSRQQ